MEQKENEKKDNKTNMFTAHIITEVYNYFYSITWKFVIFIPVAGHCLYDGKTCLITPIRGR